MRNVAIGSRVIINTDRQLGWQVKRGPATVVTNPSGDSRLAFTATASEGTINLRYQPSYSQWIWWAYLAGVLLYLYLAAAAFVVKFPNNYYRIGHQRYGGAE